MSDSENSLIYMGTVTVTKQVELFKCHACGGETRLRYTRTPVDAEGKLYCSLGCGLKVPEFKFGEGQKYWAWIRSVGRDFLLCKRCRKPYRKRSQGRMSGQTVLCHTCMAADEKPEPQAIHCQACETEFIPTRSDAKFCSNKCRQSAHRVRQIQAEATPLPNA